jgi:hypothetical protein
LNPINDPTVKGQKFLFGSFDELQHLFYISHANTNTITSDILDALPCLNLFRRYKSLNFCANTLDSIPVDVEHLVDIVGYAYFEIADQEMELLHKALVDIF